MTGILLALVLFAAVAAVATVYTASDDELTAFVDDMPNKKPKPGARDLYTVTGSTLSRAHVPSWG